MSTTTISLDTLGLLSLVAIFVGADVEDDCDVGCDVELELELELEPAPEPLALVLVLVLVLVVGLEVDVVVDVVGIGVVEVVVVVVLINLIKKHGSYGIIMKVIVALASMNLFNHVIDFCSLI